MKPSVVGTCAANDKPNHFIPGFLSIAVAAISVLPLYGYTQDSSQGAAALVIEEIKVVGFRQSVVNSIEAKRNADTIVESISASDIGGLPADSIADALIRLPGVTAVRTGGQASGLNIRGLDGDFISSTLNGREQVTTGGSRAIEFDQYPSELIIQASVYKSPKASLIEGGVAGTVELKTANPLDNRQAHTVTLNVRGMYNDRADDIDGAKERGYRISASYQGKFLDDTLGLALGYARLYQPSIWSQFIGLQYDGTVIVNGRELPISEGFEIQQKDGEETRDGFVSSIQWEPSDRLSIQTDVFHSTFDSEIFARGFRIKNLASASTTLSNETISGNAITGGTVSGSGLGNGDFAVFTVNDNDTRYTEILSGGINVQWNNGPLTLTADITYSEADGDFLNGGTRALLYDDPNDSENGRAAETISYLLKGLNVGEFSAEQSYTDLNTLFLNEVGMWPYINRNELDAYQFDAKYNIDNNALIASFELGVRYSDRLFDARRRQAGYGNEFGGHSSETPIRLTPDMVDLVQFGGELSGFPNFLALDFDKAVAAVNAANAAAGRGSFRATSNWANSWTMVQSGSVSEEVLAYYLQANIDTQWFGKTVTGNIGVRVVETDQSSDGIQQLGAGLGEPIADELGIISDEYVRTRIGQKYTDTLPSVNLNIHLSDNDQLRFSVAKVMSRPPIDRLKSGAGSWFETITIDNPEAPDGVENVDRFNLWGNTSPLLDPFYANQFDISYEHYFVDSDGAFVAAVFFKDIESFINSVTIDNFDFAAADVIVPQINPQTGNRVINGQYETAINNDEGGYIRGIELAYTQTFEFLPAPWHGLGMNTSYSYTESEVEFQTNLGGQSDNIPLPGLSEHVFNGTLFYDYENFSTRISVRYRHDYVSEQVAVESQLVSFDAETLVDYQASYALQSGINIIFQVNNLTDEPNRTYFGNEAQTGTLQRFGRQFFLGATYTY